MQQAASSELFVAYNLIVFQMFRTYFARFEYGYDWRGICRSFHCVTSAGFFTFHQTDHTDRIHARSARDFAWSYLDPSLAKGYPCFCQSANSITTAVTLVKPISLSCLAASVARPPLAHGVRFGPSSDISLK